MKKLLPILLLLCLPLTSYAALSFVQSKQNTGVTVTQVPVTISTTGGNLIVVMGGANTGGVTNTTSTDSAGNLYTLATSSIIGTGQVSMYYSANASAATSVNCNFSGTIDTTGVCTVFEISGAATTNVLDTSAPSGTASSVTNATSGIYSTANANDILIFSTRLGANQTTFTPETNYTVPANATSARQGSEYNIVSATLSNTSTVIGYNAAAANINVFGAFKAAPAAPSFIQPTTSDVTIQNSVIIGNGVVIQ